ncbi:MAG: serine hydrolase domain-containing protein, partial [Acidimicrobiales bacterium]
MTEIDGEAAAGFEAVREAFAENFSERGEVGAAIAAYHDGRKVVDLWGGDAAPGVPWVRDTMTVVWSSTKGISALVAQLLVDRDSLDLDEVVATYWPEFAANGKADTTVRDILTHGARLPYPPGYRAVASGDSPRGWGDTAALVELLQEAEPVLPEGVHGYHAITYGLLLGEVV